MLLPARATLKGRRLPPKSIERFLGSPNHITHKLMAHVLSLKHSGDFMVYFQQIDTRYEPMPGRAANLDILVEDNSLIHVGKVWFTAIIACAQWRMGAWLPKFASEVDNVTVDWHDLTVNAGSFRWPIRESLLAKYRSPIVEIVAYFS